MAFYEAHLEAQAALKKVEEETLADGTKKKKKVPKDPEAPKRPMSAYMFYAQEMRQNVVQENPNAKLVDVSKILGEMWNKLDKTKSGKNGGKKYEELAAEDRERYNQEKKIYDAKLEERKKNEAMEEEARLVQEKKEALELLNISHVTVPGEDNMSVISDLTSAKGKKKKDPNAPKKNLTAYNYFMMENRDAIKKNMDEKVTNAELLTEIGKQWKATSDFEKMKYGQKAANDKNRYDKEMAIYNKTKNH